MARRRRYGLGFSPEEHGTRAVGAADSAKEEASAAARSANAGRCAVAFTQLRSAHVWKGRLTAEIQGSDRELVMHRKAADAALEAADHAFWKTCVRKVH